MNRFKKIGDTRRVAGGVMLLGVAIAMSLACGPANDSNTVSLAACGATAAPPSEVTSMPTGNLPAVLNKTGGAITNADAKKWIQGYTREQNVEDWAIENLQSRLLESGCLGNKNAQSQLFGDELKQIQYAQDDGLQLTLTRATLINVDVVNVPQNVQDEIKAKGGVPTPYALLATWRGPANTEYVDPDGNRSPAANRPLEAGQTLTLFVGGEYRTDTGVGPIWYQDSFLLASDLGVQV